jgi:hypothetical protein
VSQLPELRRRTSQQRALFVAARAGYSEALGELRRAAAMLGDVDKLLGQAHTLACPLLRLRCSRPFKLGWMVREPSVEACLFPGLLEVIRRLQDDALADRMGAPRRRCDRKGPMVSRARALRERRREPRRVPQLQRAASGGAMASVRRRAPKPVLAGIALVVLGSRSR